MPLSVRLILTLRKILSFDVWSLNVSQAYLQSASRRSDVLIRHKELYLLLGELFLFVKPLYGLSDSGDYWRETLTKFHLHNQRMEKSTGDFALIFRLCTESLEALSGSYVDDVV